jgi:hypothetical protein
MSTSANRLQVAKIIGHASHLITAFVHLSEQYAILYPMLFVEHVPAQYGRGKQARGFAIVKWSLFLSCCQEIAKIISERDPKASSICKTMDSLSDPGIRDEFRTRYCDGRGSTPSYEDSPNLSAARKFFALEERQQHARQFDEIYDAAVRTWRQMESSSLLVDFKLVRDKITAHTQLEQVDGEYKPVNINCTGITWNDLKKTIDDIQQLLEFIGRLTRDASFTWDRLAWTLTEAGSDFWKDRS